MLKLELLALATKSCNFCSCQKRLSSYITDQVCCSYGKSLIRELYYWQKVKSTLPRVCKEKSHGKWVVKRQQVLLSASQFRNSQKLSRCHHTPMRNKPSTYCSSLFPLWLERLAKVQGLYGVVSAGVVNVSFKKSAQSPISLNRVERSTAEISLLRNPDLCHPRDFWEQDILWLLNITLLLLLSYYQKGWMPLKAGKLNCCWNLGDQDAAHCTYSFKHEQTITNGIVVSKFETMPVFLSLWIFARKK